MIIINVMNALIGWMLIGAFIGLTLDLYGTKTKRAIYSELYCFGRRVLPSESLLVEVFLWPASAWTLLTVLWQDLVAACGRAPDDDE